MQAAGVVCIADEVRLPTKAPNDSAAPPQNADGCRWISIRQNLICRSNVDSGGQEMPFGDSPAKALCRTWSLWGSQWVSSTSRPMLIVLPAVLL